MPRHCHLFVAQVSTSQEADNILEAMVLEGKTPDLLALLTAHVGGNASVVPIVPRPPTPAPPHPSATEAVEKKRKKGKQIGKENSKEGEIPLSIQ